MRRHLLFYVFLMQGGWGRKGYSPLISPPFRKRRRENFNNQIWHTSKRHLLMMKPDFFHPVPLPKGSAFLWKGYFLLSSQGSQRSPCAPRRVASERYGQWGGSPPAPDFCLHPAETARPTKGLFKSSLPRPALILWEEKSSEYTYPCIPRPSRVYAMLQRRSFFQLHNNFVSHMLILLIPIDNRLNALYNISIESDFSTT